MSTILRVEINRDVAPRYVGQAVERLLEERLQRIDTLTDDRGGFEFSVIRQSEIPDA